MSDEYTEVAFHYDLQQLTELMTTGIRRLSIPPAEVAQWLERLELPFNYPKPVAEYSAVVYMNSHRITWDPTVSLTENLDADMIAIERYEVELGWDNRRPHFIFLIDDIGDARRQVVDAFVNAMHGEANERELCPEYDQAFEQTTMRMTHKPKGRQRLYGRRMQFTVTLEFEPDAFDDRAHAVRSLNGPPYTREGLTYMLSENPQVMDVRIAVEEVDAFEVSG